MSRNRFATTRSGSRLRGDRRWSPPRPFVDAFRASAHPGVERHRSTLRRYTDHPTPMVPQGGTIGYARDWSPGL